MTAKSQLLSKQIRRSILASAVFVLFTFCVGFYARCFYFWMEFYFWYILFPFLMINMLAMLVRFILRIRAIQVVSEEDAQACSDAGELLSPKSEKVISGLGWIPLISVCAVVVLSIAGISVRPVALPASVAQTLQEEYDDVEIQSVTVSRFFGKSAVMSDLRYSVGSEYKLTFQIDVVQNVSSHFVGFRYNNSSSSFRSLALNDDGTDKYTSSKITWEDATGEWFKAGERLAIRLRTENNYVIMYLHWNDPLVSDEILTQETLIPMCYALLTEEPNYADEWIPI